jgi:hypothetical protein
MRTALNQACADSQLLPRVAGGCRHYRMHTFAFAGPAAGA